MTSKEEQVLHKYLAHYGEAEDDETFETWYMQRYEDAESEDRYKNTVYLAQTWKRRYEEGFRASFAYQKLCSQQSAGLTQTPM